MSRSGYSEDLNNWALICWRGAVNSAIKGKRGQALLHELAAAMDAMLVKELVAHELEVEGSYCALGVVGHARGIEMNKLDPEDYDTVAAVFNIAPALAREIVYKNDEQTNDKERRWRYMRKWVEEKLIPLNQSTHLP